MLLGLLLREPSLATKLLHQRVILGEALELALAQNVRAAVADVPERDLIATDHRGGQGGPHAGT